MSANSPRPRCKDCGLPFSLLRAADDKDTDYERRLADTNYALRLLPDSAEALWIRARLLTRAGCLFSATHRNPG